MELHVATGYEIESYPGALSQILTNFIINSLQHAFEPDDIGKISIKVTSDNGGCLLVYSDNGKGIDELHRRKIFEPFFTTRRSQGGSGLGLHIVYNIVTQQLGGSIDVESTPGSGTVFRIKFPV